MKFDHSGLVQKRTLIQDFLIKQPTNAKTGLIPTHFPIFFFLLKPINLEPKVMTLLMQEIFTNTSKNIVEKFQIHREIKRFFFSNVKNI